MHHHYRFKLLTAVFILCGSAILSADSVTRTRDEKLLNVEIGTLTEPNETNPSGILITLKTDKQPYYVLHFVSPEVVTETPAEVNATITKGKAITTNPDLSCVALHLLFPLRSDDTPDNPRANCSFYPDRRNRGQFNSPEWGNETYPRFNGMLMTKIPVALGNMPVAYRSVFATTFRMACIIETQEDKPKGKDKHFSRRACNL